MSDVEAYMFAQIQTLANRITLLDADNKAYRTFHEDPIAAEAVAAAQSDETAGDAAKIGVDPITNVLIVSAAKGNHVEVPSMLRVGKYHNVESTLQATSADQARCNARQTSLENELAALKITIADIKRKRERTRT